MLFQENISLQGQFKFDVYKSDGSLRYTSDYIKNFITSTGLNYPSVYAFADCFRFISLGTGSGANSIMTGVNGGWGTTGLQFPISKYSYVGGKTCEGQSLYETEACGFLEQSNTVRLTRAWRLPTGTDVFEQNYTIREFMVSPGRPAVVDPSNPSSKACHCQEYTTPSSLPGLDGSTVAKYYSNPSICDADKAFARVIKTIDIKQDDFLVVTYDLNLSFNTGVQNIALSIQNTDTTNWSGVLRAKANLVHHGLKLIDDGIHSYAGREQIPDFAFGGADYGESFVSYWGAPLEPSCPINHVQAYLTTDNIQFLVNRVSGGAWDSSLPVPTSGSGIMAWHPRPTTEVANAFPDQLISVRTKGDQAYYPDSTDYTAATTAVAMDYDVSYVTGSRSQHTPLEDSFTKHSRYRTGNYSFQFWGNNEVDFHGKPIRGLVMSYYDSSNPGALYPVFDMTFANRTGKYPGIQTGPKTYSLPYEDPNNPPATGYFYAENGGILTMTFKMSWSSPCDVSVSGC